jgi:hypothetical protein
VCGNGTLRHDAALYPYQDEVGALFLAYQTRAKLLEKPSGKKYSRLSGCAWRLTASIAHEINNRWVTEFKHLRHGSLTL